MDMNHYHFNSELNVVARVNYRFCVNAKPPIVEEICWPAQRNIKRYTLHRGRMLMTRYNPLDLEQLINSIIIFLVPGLVAPWDAPELRKKADGDTQLKMMEIQGSRVLTPTLSSLFVLTLLLNADAEICYRKFLGKKHSHDETGMCKGHIRRRYFSSAEDCCRYRRSAGVWFMKVKVGGRRNVYLCTKCSAIIGQNNSQDINALYKKKNPWDKHKVKPKVKRNNSWTIWSPWSSCNQTCGSGVQIRTRQCTDKNKTNCRGPRSETKLCQSLHLCSGDGSWGPWHAWQSCSVSCGGGAAVRIRICIISNKEGRICPGSSYQSKICGARPCPVNGSWGSWSNWSSCNETCGNTRRHRVRRCDSPAPKHGGLPCQGKRKERELCPGTKPCPVDGGWSLWSRWSQCSSGCETRIRTRDCDAPKPRHGGKDCSGESVQDQACTALKKCANMVWANWEPWGPCRAASCSDATGTRVRVRRCVDKGTNSSHGRCGGKSFQAESCVRPTECKISGGWCAWQPWGRCLPVGAGSDKFMPKEYSFGFRVRHRRCECPPPLDGKHCKGEPFAVKGCTLPRINCGNPGRCQKKPVYDNT